MVKILHSYFKFINSLGCSKIFSKHIIVICFFISCLCSAQDITQYTSFHGSYDFLMIGNTLNPMANGAAVSCSVLSQSSANLALQNNQQIEAAYLYWSGSGTLDQADLNIKLNGVDIEAERTFTTTFGNNTTTYAFGAFANITGLVQSIGNGIYTFSDLDLNSVVNLPTYCSVGLNYAGWAVIIVYKDISLPNNIVSIYDGFESVSSLNPSISITLSGLNVVNSTNAKLGFLAWEGDANIAVEEQLFINGTLISNPPLNPANNVFNCTNSYTNAADLWNMDLDFFDISALVDVGDTSLNFSINTGQDTVITNCFAVSLNSELSDAAILIDNVELTCDSREIEVDFTVSNLNEYINLPNNVPISFYVDNQYLTTVYTTSAVPVSSSLSSTTVLSIPITIGKNFVLKAWVDDIGNETGVVTETDEENNTDLKEITLKASPKIKALTDFVLCDEDEDDIVTINLTENESALISNLNTTTTYYKSEEDAENNANSIVNPGNYKLVSYSKETIWIRFQSTVSECYTIDSFSIMAQRKALANVQQPIIICNDKNNPKIVNLGLVQNFLSENYPYLKNLNLYYYQTYEDAVNETNDINQMLYQPVFLPTIIYLRGKGINELWCDNIIEIQLNNCIVPKGISPNGDNLNDNLNLEGFNVVELKIFNRYGNLVYEYGSGYKNQWYGQDANGNYLPAGTYFYSFKTKYEIYTGYIHVIREVK